MRAYHHSVSRCELRAAQSGADAKTTREIGRPHFLRAQYNVHLYNRFPKTAGRCVERPSRHPAIRIGIGTGFLLRQRALRPQALQWLDAWAPVTSSLRHAVLREAAHPWLHIAEPGRFVIL
jgi:hypothetical protein